MIRTVPAMQKVIFDFERVLIVVWPDLDRVLITSPLGTPVMMSVNETLEALERARSDGD